MAECGSVPPTVLVFREQKQAGLSEFQAYKVYIMGLSHNK